MAVKLKDSPQRKFPVWENIVLVVAQSEKEALRKAEMHGRFDEGGDDGTFGWGGKPATWVFMGVRKLTECMTLTDRVEDGTKISFNELELDSEEAVDQLASGRPAAAMYNDQCRTVETAKPGRRTTRLPAKNKHPAIASEAVPHVTRARRKRA